MTDLAHIQFAKPTRKLAGTVLALIGPELALGPQAAALAFVLLALALVVTALILAIMRPGRVQGSGR